MPARERVAGLAETEAALASVFGATLLSKQSAVAEERPEQGDGPRTYLGAWRCAACAALPRQQSPSARRRAPRMRRRP